MKFTSFLKEKIRKHRVSALLEAQKIHLHNRIYLFGDPRSGSTWISEMICRATNGILVDEPLNINNSQFLRSQNFYWRQEIPHNAHWQEVEEFFSKLDQLAEKDFYVYLKSNKIASIQNSDTAVYKIIRGKMLLSWFLEKRKPSLKPIVLIRNPYASIVSQINHSSWNYSFTKHETPEGAFNAEYHKYDSYLKSLESKTKKLTAHWCISNLFLLENKVMWRDRCHFLCYKNLLNPGNKSLNQILNSYDISYDEDSLRRITIPSSTSNNLQPIDGFSQVNKWKETITEKQENEISEVLSYFGMSDYDDFVSKFG